MRSTNFLTPLILILAVMSFCLTPQADGFISEENKITLYNIGSSPSAIRVGDQVEISMYVKNFANFTLTNVTIGQNVTGSLRLSSSPYGVFNGTELSLNISDNIEVREEISQIDIALTHLNMSSTNFTMGFASIPSNASYMFKFSVNAIEDGLGTVEFPTMTYFDNFLDEQTFIGEYDLEYSISEVPVYSINGYFPDVETADANLVLIVFIGVGILMVGILGRSLYLKKPIEI